MDLKTLKDQIRAEMQLGAMQDPLITQWVKDGLDWMSDYLRHVRSSGEIETFSLAVGVSKSYWLPLDYLERFVGEIDGKPITIADYKSFRGEIPSSLEPAKYAYIEPAAEYTPSGGEELTPSVNQMQITFAFAPELNQKINFDYIGQAPHPTSDTDLIDSGGFEYDRLLKAYLRCEAAKHILKDMNSIQLYTQEKEELLKALQGKRDRKTGTFSGVLFHWAK